MNTTVAGSFKFMILKDLIERPGSIIDGWQDFLMSTGRPGLPIGKMAVF
jgi:hypothetical protein